MIFKNFQYLLKMFKRQLAFHCKVCTKTAQKLRSKWSYNDLRFLDFIYYDKILKVNIKILNYKKAMMS